MSARERKREREIVCVYIHLIHRESIIISYIMRERERVCVCIHIPDTLRGLLLLFIL